MMNEPFFVTHAQDDAARQDAINNKQDIINNSNILFDRVLNQRTIIEVGDTFISEVEPLTPAQIIFYMLDEAMRRTDMTKDGEFGIASGHIWYYKGLDTRINEYIERLKGE